MGHHFLKPCDFTVISVSKVLYFVKVSGCETFKQRVAQKIENGWGARVAVVPALMYSTIFYSRDKQPCKYCLDFSDTVTIYQRNTDNTLDWVRLVYHWSVWAREAHLRSVLLCSTHTASSNRELFQEPARTLHGSCCKFKCLLGQ
jgi:hypothetical protein